MCPIIYCHAAGARSHWHNRCHGPNAVGFPFTHNPNRVLQARERCVLTPAVGCSRPQTGEPTDHTSGGRAITGFHDDFLWCGTKIEIARQIGNAVPVGLAQVIAKHLKPYL